MKITKKQLKRIIKEERAKLIREEKRKLAEQAMAPAAVKPGVARAKVKKNIMAGEKIWFAFAQLIDDAMDQAQDADDMRTLADDLRGYADDVEDSIPEGE